MKNKIKFLVLSSLLISSSINTGLAASFSDVPETHPAFKAVEFLKQEGIIGGYPDGTFKPDQVVNRAEALKIVLSAKKITTNDVTNTSFSDVKAADWFAKYVETAKNMKIVNGNPDGTFAPGRNVNKAEYLKMLLLAYEVKFVNYKNPDQPLYADTPDSSQWFIPYFDFAKNVNIITPNSKNEISPSKDLTRGEVADMTYKLAIILKGGPVQLYLSRAESSLMQSMIDLQSGNLDAATNSIKEAKDLANQALQKAPDQSIVKSAVKIIDGFEALLSAFKDSAAKNYDSGIKNAGLAYNLAEEAKNINPGIDNLSTQLKSAAKSIADGMRAAKAGTAQ